MRIVISEISETIPFSDLIKATLRSDLFPVPMHIEFTVNRVDKYVDKLALNKEILVADYNTPFIILKSCPVRLNTLKYDEQAGAIYCFAIPKIFQSMMTPLSVPKYLKNTSFRGVVRSIGVKGSFGNDIPLKGFTALRGSYPSERLADYMQQEACVLQFKNEVINFTKVDDFFKKDEILTLSKTGVAWFDSEQAGLLTSTAYAGIDTDGATQLGGNLTKNVKVTQRAGLDARQLANLEKTLILRGIAMQNFDMKLQAGEVVKIDSVKYVIITAAHYVETGNIGTPSATLTKIWIGKLK